MLFADASLVRRIESAELRLLVDLAEAGRARNPGADVLITTGQVQNILWSVMTRVPTLRDLITVEKMQSGRESTSPVEEIGPDDPLFLQFTSGSTAAPKGVVLLLHGLSRSHSALQGTPEGGD